MKKIVLMMKFYLVFTFLGVLNVIAGSAYSQENLKLNLKEVSLMTLFREIQKQTGIDFVYNEEQCRDFGKVSVEISDGMVEQLLQQVFDSSKLTYRFENGVIMIKALNVRHLPQFGLFVQGAYGNPGLNMLKNEFSPYYIAGVRLSWNFGSLYTLKNDRKVIENKRRQLDNNRDVFLFNTRLEMTQQDQAIQSLEKQMQDDDEIIRLRTNIRKSAEAKVANGTLTVTEMLRELTNESLARQSKALHEIQRLMGIYQLKYTTND